MPGAKKIYNSNIECLWARVVGKQGNTLHGGWMLVSVPDSFLKQVLVISNQ